MSEEIFVYADTLECRPGDEMALYVSASTPQDVTISLVKPHAAGETSSLDWAYEPVAAVPSVHAHAGPQTTYNGSFGLVEDVTAPDTMTALTMTAFIWPTRPGAEAQTIMSWQTGRGRIDLGLDGDGNLHGSVYGGDALGGEVTGERPLTDRQWYLVALTVRPDGDSHQLILTQVPLGASDPSEMPASATETCSVPERMGGTGRLVLAASRLVQAPDGQIRTPVAFDGKIDSPALLADVLDTGELETTAVNGPAWLDHAFAAWDFGSDFSSDRFRSRVAGQPDGRLINAPARGMTGRNWTGDILDFRHAPEQYGAIHFHSDDLEDAAWQRTASLRLPDDLPSGIYCALVEGERVQDHVPVVVSRAAGHAAKDVLFLVPTYSYIAYANSRLAEELDYSDGVLTDLPVGKQYRDAQVYAHREFGMSLYDHHADGSGNCYSSHLRPIPNMRWDFRSGLQSAPRHFAADLVWPAWFDAHGIDYDVLSDHGLDERGSSALENYRLIITGSHPEYWSGAMLDAVEDYLADGGSLAYVGGNGFYWVTSASRERPHLLEVRRGQQGIRTWEGEPGEAVSTQTSEPGGLWRLRGRAPNRLVGVGMAAQGWDTSTPGFELTPEARDPRVADLFDGIEENVIGDFGLVLGGAAGDEIDRADVRLGTPRHALVIARSQPHSAYYLAASEELNTPTPHINGTNNPNVRADITFYEHRGGGFVVSTSAITWTGSMAYRHFDNNVSRFMRNVVRKAVGPLAP